MNTTKQNVFYYIFQWIIYLLDCIIPKKKSNIYFFSAFMYPDNVEAIVNELLKDTHQQSYTIFLDSTKCELEFSDTVVKVKHMSPKALLCFFRSKYVFCDVGVYGIDRPVKNQTVINTWHGTSLKKIGYYLEPDRKRKPAKATYVVGYSPFFKKALSTAFGVKEDNVIISGEPRNDFLFDGDSSILEDLQINKLDYPKILIWMPTYRHNTVTKAIEGTNYDFGIPLLTRLNIDDLNESCKKNNTLLIIKWHGMQIVDDIKNREFSNIRFITSEDIQATGKPLYHLVACCDGLITDYSSIYINYLVLNRPICFVYDDMESYMSKRGFMFDDVKSIMPGFHAQSFDELAHFIKEFSVGKDEYKEERERVNKILNTYSDNKNSYRLLKAVGLID